MTKDGAALYHSEFFVFDQEKPIPVVIRNYTQEDFDALIQIQSECFPPPFPSELWWNKEQLSNHVMLFPEGAICIEVDGTLAGSLTGLCVNFDPNHMEHTWEKMTDHGYIKNHYPQTCPHNKALCISTPHTYIHYPQVDVLICNNGGNLFLI